METRFTLLLLFTISLNISAQFGVQQIISTEVNGAYSVVTADIDGDGDMDVISASYLDDKIAWYENTDGQGSFGVQQIISTNADETYSVYVADIDGDGDIDVLSASSSDDRIAWYENTDGQGSFGEQQTITTDANGALQVYAADLDGDGDQDVLSASRFDDKIAWYENTDGQGSFSSELIITANAVAAFSVHANDLDGDGDMDVVSASFNDDKIAWYENTNGQGVFSAEQIITTGADGARSVYSVDIDGDGDIDVLSASSWDNKITWYENTDGQGNFGEQQPITTIAFGANQVFASDMDGDGDMDVLSASWDNKIAWYENADGLGSFGEQQIISTDIDIPGSVYAADLDGDNELDVLSASSEDDKVAWYKNVGVTGIDQNTATNNTLKIYPSPVSDQLNIETENLPTGEYNLRIVDLTGKAMINEQMTINNSKEVQQLDVNALPAGIYMVIVQNKDAQFIQRVVKE